MDRCQKFLSSLEHRWLVSNLILDRFKRLFSLLRGKWKVKSPKWGSKIGNRSYYSRLQKVLPRFPKGGLFLGNLHYRLRRNQHSSLRLYHLSKLRVHRNCLHKLLRRHLDLKNDQLQHITFWKMQHYSSFPRLHSLLQKR